MAGAHTGIGRARLGRCLALATILILAARPGAADAGGEDLGPSARDLAIARAAARRFRAPGGLKRAVATLCRGDGLPADEAAYTVLVARGAEAMPHLPDAQASAFAACVNGYLCGPARRSYQATLARCCARVFGAQPPAFCAADR